MDDPFPQQRHKSTKKLEGHKSGCNFRVYFARVAIGCASPISRHVDPSYRPISNSRQEYREYLHRWPRKESQTNRPTPQA